MDIAAIALVLSIYSSVISTVLLSLLYFRRIIGKADVEVIVKSVIDLIWVLLKVLNDKGVVDFDEVIKDIEKELKAMGYEASIRVEE